MMQKRIAYLELYFCKVFRYKYFCKKLYFGHCNLSTYKDLLERYLPERIKSFVRYLQFMVGQKHTLVGHSILLQIFPVGQNVRYVFRLVGRFSNLVGHCPMFDRYFKAWYYNFLPPKFILRMISTN